MFVTLLTVIEVQRKDLLFIVALVIAITLWGWLNATEGTDEDEL